MHTWCPRPPGDICHSCSYYKLSSLNDKFLICTQRHNRLLCAGLGTTPPFEPDLFIKWVLSVHEDSKMESIRSVLRTANYGTSLRENLKDLYKSRNIPCSWTVSLNIIKIPNLPKFIYTRLYSRSKPNSSEVFIAAVVLFLVEFNKWTWKCCVNVKDKECQDAEIGLA